MIALPKSTEFNKRIPKQKFYENIEISPPVKKMFSEQVKNIYWRNKIATSTMNLAEGKEVQEIEIFEIMLNTSEINEGLLRQIDKAIPYHILYLLQYQDKYQAWICHKEAGKPGAKANKVNAYYHTDWLVKEELPLKVIGLSIDKVYESFVRQIAGDSLGSGESGESLKASIDRDIQRQALQKQIDCLLNKIRKEKQLNKQVELNTELKKLRKEMEAIAWIK